MNRKRAAFTLVEILMVVAIVGVIATAAVAPLVYSVVRIVAAEEEQGEQEALYRVAALITREVSEAMRTAPDPVLRVIKNDRLASVADYSLVFASVSPVRQNLSAGSIAYRVVRRNAFSTLPEGLYRWVIAGKIPKEIDVGKLDEAEAQLVITDIKEFKIEVLEKKEWVDEYGGKLPEGMKFAMARGEQRIEQVEWIPK